MIAKPTNTMNLKVRLRMQPRHNLSPNISLPKGNDALCNTQILRQDFCHEYYHKMIILENCVYNVFDVEMMLNTLELERKHLLFNPIPQGGGHLSKCSKKRL